MLPVWFFSRVDARVVLKVDSLGEGEPADVTFEVLLARVQFLM